MEIMKFHGPFASRKQLPKASLRQVRAPRLRASLQQLPEGTRLSEPLSKHLNGPKAFIRLTSKAISMPFPHLSPCLMHHSMCPKSTPSTGTRMLTGIAPVLHRASKHQQKGSKTISIAARSVQVALQVLHHLAQCSRKPLSGQKRQTSIKPCCINRPGKCQNSRRA